jgi:hypothetical protein
MLTDAQSTNSSSFESSNSGLIQASNPLQLPTFPQSRPSSSQTIAFVDANIPDALVVMAGLQSDIKVLLDPTHDGVSQITDALKHYTNLTGVSIISHGSDASLQLGNGTLNATSLQQYADELQQWSSALAPDADVLFYGCNVAATNTGQNFIQNLSALTGADVAASNDPTGNATLGGDWLLEYNTGTIETPNPFTSSLVSTYEGLLATQIFTSSTTPSISNFGDGFSYEFGLKFTSSATGKIDAIRYYKAASETGTHIGKIWSSSGQLLASVTFTNETASGWQQQALTAPLTIAANTTYVVSVNANDHYVASYDQLATPIASGALSTLPSGGVYAWNTTGTFPTQSYRDTNYFRDIVFTPTVSNPNNNPGTVTLNGSPTQNQTLTANVADADGLTGVTINYQWQQSSNGTTWTAISGATNQTFTLTQAQVGSQVRAVASYTDALGSNETINSTPTTAVGNVNDLGAIAIGGITSQGNTLTATVTDADGLTGATINYQWQKSSNGTTWANITGATNQTLTLDSTLVGQLVRANAIYTDVLGGNENILSTPTSAITASSPTQTLFTTQTPTLANYTDGSGSAGDYEFGMEFKAAKSGTINAIRYYKAASETGTHVGKIWSSGGQLLGSVTFTNETASGWQQQALTTPIAIQANTTYIVSVNANTYYVATPNGLATTLANGDISAVADGSNGVFNFTPDLFPTQSYNNTNYFRDIVFAPTVSNPNNNPGTVTLNGSPTQNQTLTANVADTDGLTGVTINYQWQQSSNGTTWTAISGATNQTFTLTQAQVGSQVRAVASYTDALGTKETATSNPTTAVSNVNNTGLAILAGSATTGANLQANIFDADGLTGATINYQWQRFINNTWSNIAGATAKSIALTSTLLGLQVRVLASYIDALGSSENITSSGATIAAQNAIVLENQKTGTTAWQITNQASNNEIAGFASATSINKGESLPIKVSLATPGQYKIDIYRLGYYGGTGGRLITSSGLLNGVTQAGPTTDSTTNLVEYKWNTSYTLQTGADWTTGLYSAKLTDITTGKQSQVWFTIRDDNRPADLGFQEAVTTTEAYNNYGGYSVYGENSIGGQRAYKVSFDRPFGLVNNVEGFNNRMTWEYNMVRWLESQGYDVSYYTNLDVHINPLQLYSQKTFLSVGHDEYWSMEMRNNVEQARDNGINMGFFSANTAYWRVRFEPSSTGEANRVMTVYKDSWALDPVAQLDSSAATTRFRSTQINRPENALLGVMYTGNTGVGAAFGGFSYVVSNASDPYYANTGLRNGDTFSGLVGYEWDAIVNNGFTPPGLVTLSQSPVSPVGSPPPLPAGTDTSISNAVRYTASSGAKVFSTGSIQWAWGLDSFGLSNSRVDSRVQQITVNVLSDMGAKPQTPSSGIVVA